MQQEPSPLRFLCLVYVLTAPLWLLSGAVHLSGLPDNLPVTDAAATFAPMAAAALLTFRQGGIRAVTALMRRAVDYSRLGQHARYLPVFLLFPVLYALTYGIMRLAEFPVPATWRLPADAIPVFIAFLAAAAGEELGYTAYAIDPMQARYGPLKAALLLGAVHAVWHYPSMMQLGQSPALMAWGTLFTIAARVLTVWLYNSTGSVFAAILFHAIGNTARSVFPGGRPAFELADGAIGYGLVALAAFVVVAITGGSLNFRREPLRR
jgi:membrane protease YdiL (CAAX protease family)